MGYQDHSLARGVLEGDADAVGRAIRWISEVLTGSRFWSLREEWPDLVQESLTRVVESLQDGRFDQTKDLRSYVQGIARHTAIRALQGEMRRRGRRDDVMVEDLPMEDGPSPADPVSRQQLVRRALDESSEECRLLLQMYFLQEKGYEEIAAELILPVGTVKSRVSRCLDCVQRAMRVAIRRRVRSPLEEKGAIR
jgi:RNA polymerase sigma-70 factor (ECF subfamily)